MPRRDIIELMTDVKMTSQMILYARNMSIGQELELQREVMRLIIEMNERQEEVMSYITEGKTNVH